MNRNVRSNTLFPWFADHLHDLAGCLFNMRWKIQDFRNHNLAVFCRASFALRDQNAMRDFRIIRNDHADATLTNKLAGDLMRTAFENLHKPGLIPAATIFACSSHRDPVTMENRAHLARRQIHIFAAVIPA